MERENGFRIIDDFRRINRVPPIFQGDFCDDWYTDGYTNNLFKLQDTLMSYRELFYPFTLQKLELPTVRNDLAKRDNCLGIISEDYTINKLCVKNVATIIYEYYKYNNLEIVPYYVIGLKNALVWYCKINNFIFDEQSKKELLERFIMQILLGNSDLKASNMEIYIENSRLRFSPFYDFGFCGTIDIKNSNKKGYKFQYKMSDNYDAIPADVTIKYFLTHAPKNEIELFQEYLINVQEIQADEIFGLIKEQTKYNVPEGVQIVLKRELKKNLENVNSIIKG